MTALPSNTAWSQQLRPATQLVRGGLRRTGFDETSEALFLTSGYVYGTPEEAEAAFKGESDHYIYSRYGNPTVAAFEERLALLEGAEHCQATSSGMAAVFAALASQLKSGDRVVASRALFGSCDFILTEILPGYGIETVLVDGADLAAWERALAGNAKAVFIETPANPTLDLVDLAAVASLAHAAGATVIVDNVFATPILQQPLTLGADIVVYSATKHIDGQGRCLGGAILCTKAFFKDYLQPFIRHTGPSMSPFNAWVLLKSLETLDLRISRHCQNAEKIAQTLAGVLGDAAVRYPGHASHPHFHLAQQQMQAGGTIVTFTVAPDKAGAFRFLRSLNLVDISNNLGDAKSLITHPSTTTHARLTPGQRTDLGINDGMVRLSVGLEDAADVTADLLSALESV